MLYNYDVCIGVDNYRERNCERPLVGLESGRLCVVIGGMLAGMRFDGHYFESDGGKGCIACMCIGVCCKEGSEEC